MSTHLSGPSRGLRLGLFVAVGIAAGVLYGQVDRGFDDRLVAGTLTGWLADVHASFGYALPILTGMLLAFATFSWRERAMLARRETGRALSLQKRLEHVERDQAVWVMAASVLHEVRNPLHALGLLLDDLARLSADQGSETASLVERCHTQMERIAAQMDLLRTMRASIAPEPAPVDLRELVESVLDGRAKDLRSLHLQPLVRGPENVMVLGDPIYIRIILESLLDNSLQALRDSSGSLVLEVSKTERGATVRVGDSGSGIAREKEDVLFTPFASTRERGLGLGLPIARALARAMDGDLRFEGRVAGETRFALELPMTAQG